MAFFRIDNQGCSMMLKKFVIIWAVLVCGSACAALPIQSWTLPNGTRVLFAESHAVPILDISIEFDAGARRDPAGKPGLASLTSQMLTAGIHASPARAGAGLEPGLTEAQISDAFADIAAQRDASVSNDRAGATLRTLSSAAERNAAVTLLARILAQPDFPADLVARDKARNIAALKEELTKPEEIAARAFRVALYGQHPYAMDATAESLQAMTHDDLVSFHRTHYVANRAVIAMIGDMTRSDAEAVAQQLTARLPQGVPLPALPQVQAQPGREQRIPHPASQAHILIGMPALVRGDPDYFALTVGNYVLGGGGFVSRLTREVREKRGLVYGVYSYFNPLLQKGPFQIGLETKKEQTDAALKVVHDVLATYLEEGPSAAELKAAKDNLIGGFALRLDNNHKILENLAVIGYYNLPLDYLDTWMAHVASVTAADIRAAFNRKIALQGLSTVIVGTEVAAEAMKSNEKQ
jgi:zinc protease